MTKPALHLMKPGKITGQTLADLFERLTGEKSSPEQIEQMQRDLDANISEEDKAK